MAKSIENSASGRKKSESSNSATSRIESTQHTALHHAFTDILSQYQNAQVEYMNRCKEKIMLDLEISKFHFENPTNCFIFLNLKLNFFLKLFNSKF